MNDKKFFMITWGVTGITTTIPAENEDDARSKFLLGIKEEYRNDPDLIKKIEER